MMFEVSSEISDYVLVFTLRIMILPLSFLFEIVSMQAFAFCGIKRKNLVRIGNNCLTNYVKQDFFLQQKDCQYHASYYLQTHLYRLVIAITIKNIWTCKLHMFMLFTDLK